MRNILKMKNLNKSEKLKFFIDKAVKYGLTAYRIAVATGLSERGVLNILEGSVTNPQAKTVDKLFDYITEFDTERIKNNSVKESQVSYERHSFELTKDDLTAEGVIAKKVISRLEPAIRKNQSAVESIQSVVLTNGVQLEEVKIILEEMRLKLDAMHEVVVGNSSK